MYLDELMREAFRNSPNTVVAWLLMASYLYYHAEHEAPILSDTTFDKACKWLYDNWDDVEHRHKHLIKKDDLRAGSIYALKKEDYPQITAITAVTLSQEHSRNQLNREAYNGNK